MAEQKSGRKKHTVGGNVSQIKKSERTVNNSVRSSKGGLSSLFRFLKGENKK